MTANPSDSLPQRGYGNPTRPCGLIHSGFRPSDDACIFPFLIPSNLFAVTALDQLAGDLRRGIAKQAVRAGVRGTGRRGSRGHRSTHGASPAQGGRGLRLRGGRLRQPAFHGRRQHPQPAVAAIPRVCAADDPVYLRTRAWVLSDDNPYFFRGTAAEGLGGPHSGLGMIWPLGIITRALTSRSEQEVARCLAMLKRRTPGPGSCTNRSPRTTPRITPVNGSRGPTRCSEN